MAQGRFLLCSSGLKAHHSQATHYALPCWVKQRAGPLPAEQTLPARIRLRPGLDAGPATGGPARPPQPTPASLPRSGRAAPSAPALGAPRPARDRQKGKNTHRKERRKKKKKKVLGSVWNLFPRTRRRAVPAVTPAGASASGPPGGSYSRRPAGPRAPLPTSLSALSRGASARRFAAANSSPIPLRSLSTRIKNFFRKSIIAEKCQMNARANAPLEGLAEPPVPGRAEPTRWAPLEQRKVGKKETLFRFAGGFIWNADFSLQGHEQKATRLVSCYPVPARHGPAEVHCTGTSRPRPGTRAGRGRAARPGRDNSLLGNPEPCGRSVSLKQTRTRFWNLQNCLTQH